MESVRRKRRTISVDDRVAAAKAKVETEYKTLLAKRDESRRKMLMDAIAKSRRTFDEVMNFVRG